jgi:VCBS repeat-containing protein
MLHGTRIASDGSAFDVAPLREMAVDRGIRGDPITVPDAHLLFNGDFQRAGPDLKIVGADGKSFLIPDYFKAEKRATLLSPEGASLTPEVVEALAGPLAPGQYAQAGQQASDQPAIGRIEQVAGNATIVRNGVAMTANQGDVVRKGDVVQTGGDGMIAVLFADGSTFSLSANARMVLNDFVYQAGGANNSALISLVQGTIGFVAGQVAKTGDMRVDTPAATMGIRGTAVLVEITAQNGQTKFSVLVEPDGTTGSFNLYNKSTGALIATVNNSQIGWVVTPAGPLEVIAQQIQKTPGELQQELNYFQQIFNIFNQGQQNPFNPEQRTDTPNPQNTSGSGTQFTTVLPNNTNNSTNNNNQPDIFTVSFTPLTTPTGGNDPINFGNTAPNFIPDNNLPPSTYTIIDYRNTNYSGVINGTPGADIIFGSNAGNTIHADDGDDFVFAGSGNDIIIAGHGGGDDFYDGGGGVNTIKYESATQGIVFNLNVESVNGVVQSTADGPEIGHDIFVNFQVVVGGQGNDVFILHDGFLWDLDGGAGIDIVRLAGNLSFTGHDEGPDVYGVEIVDLNTTHTNTVEFEADGIAAFNDDKAIRVIGGADDTVILNEYHPGENSSGYWVLVGSVLDPFGDDDLTDGITFLHYQFVDGEAVVATMYIQDGITVVIPHQQAHAPVAVPDTNSVIEAGVIWGNFPFFGDPFAIGNVLTNDTDADANDTKSVVGVAAGSSEGAISGGVNAIVQGTYGFLLLLSTGGYLYTLNNLDPDTQALAKGEVVEDVFTYTMQDGFGLTSTSTLTISITGANDAPVIFAGTISGTVIEDGYGGDGKHRSDPTATGSLNVFDPDGGDSFAWSLVRRSGQTLNENGSITGRYGTLTIDQNGQWTYTLDDQLPQTQALTLGQTVRETFTVKVTDGNGASDTQTVTISIQGSNEGQGPTGVAFAIDPSGVADDNGTSLSKNTKVGTFTAFGDPDIGDTFAYSLAQGSSGAFKISTDGQLSTGNSNVGPGTYQLYVVASDQAGNVSPATQVTIWVDNANTNATPEAFMSSSNTIIAFGLNGNDIIVAGNGDDVLVGGQNNDVLSGGAGNDVLIGGGGADTFVFKPGGGHDTILDFSHSQGDKIDLSGYDIASFDSLSVAVSGADTLIDLGNGNSVTVQNTVLQSQTTLVASDFILHA